MSKKKSGKNNKHKPLIVLGIILTVVALVFGITVLSITHSKNIRTRMLLSVVHFATHTLEDEGYLFHNLDLMKLLADYGNGEVAVSGKAGINYMKDFNMSSAFNIEAYRSFPRGRMSAKAGVQVLWMNIGDMYVYGEDETVYIMAPMLEGMDAAFPTGVDLFMKMPELTSDIDKEWFKANIKNIFEFSGQMKVVETGAQINDPDGTHSEEYKITIPEGCGHFIWELLGMEDPTYDVVVQMYLTDDNHMRRIEIGLEDVLPGGKIVVDGESVGTFIMTYELPDNESAELTIVRDASHSSTSNFTGVYYTNGGDVYTATGQFTWLKRDYGAEIHAKDLKLVNGAEVLAEGYFTGDIKPHSAKEDIFDGNEDYLYSLEEIDWKTIRNDVEGFVEDVIDKMRGK